MIAIEPFYKDFLDNDEKFNLQLIKALYGCIEHP
jgi:hypothetical protein